MVKKLRLGRWPLCLAVLISIICSLHMARDSFFFERAATFSEGMEICFDRLRRSYLFALSKKSGIFLEHSFLQDTESCFSELVFYTEQHFSLSLVKDVSPINSLVTDIHWFHRDLMHSENKISLREPFEKLEDTRRGIISRMESERKRRSRFLETARKLFFVASGVGIILFLFRLPRKRQKVVEVESPPMERQEEKRKPIRVPLPEVFSMVLDSLADKILAQGIRVELELREGTEVYARKEPLQQGLEALLCNIFKLSKEEGGRLKISKEHRKERTVLLLNSFTDKVFDTRVFADLMEKSGGKIEESLPGQVNISFVSAPQTERATPIQNRLVKGKKKEVLRQLSSLQDQ